MTRLARIGAIAALCLVIASSTSSPEVVVPDVVGADVHSAYAKLRQAGFVVRIYEPIEATPNQTAYVSGQSAAGGEPARGGGAVSLKLQRGPHGLLHPGPPALRMPRLLGKPLADAVQTLLTLGLSWGADPLPPLPAGTGPTLLHHYEVSGQEPQAGARFRQTVMREVPEGIATETTPVWLKAKLRK